MMNDTITLQEMPHPVSLLPDAILLFDGATWHIATERQRQAVLDDYTLDQSGWQYIFSVNGPASFVFRRNADGTYDRLRVDRVDEMVRTGRYDTTPILTTAGVGSG